MSLHANVGWNQQWFPVSSRVASVLVVGQAGFVTLNPTVDGQNLVNQLGRFKSVVTVVHAVAEEILHHLGCTVNNGMNYLSTGAGFLPSTVGCFLHQHIE